jgi:endonuclease/exonuclease/phosphatase family metal-dependent hydrolase
VKTPQLRYVRVLHAALAHYDAFIREAPTVMIGDFNSNAIWDKRHNERSHSLLVEKLAGLGLHSVYHVLEAEGHGSETIPTWYMYRHHDKGYHLDYAFAPMQMIADARVEIGAPEQWLGASDHMPLVTAFPMPLPNVDASSAD